MAVMSSRYVPSNRLHLPNAADYITTDPQNNGVRFADAFNSLPSKSKRGAPHWAKRAYPTSLLPYLLMQQMHSPLLMLLLLASMYLLSTYEANAFAPT